MKFSTPHFRAGAFECHPELTCYHSSLQGGDRRRRSSTRDSPLLLSHDIDDSQPPNVSYASTHSLNSDEEEANEEGEEEVGGADTSDPSMDTSQIMDWEHLDPSLEELHLFEEEQMRLALTSAKPTTTFSSSSDQQHRAACEQAQEAEIYRQRLRRLDYNSTYMDYAALTSTGSSGAGTPLAGTAGVDSLRSLGSAAGTSAEETSRERTGKWLAAKEGSPSGPEPTAEASSGGTVASGIFGTLSSLWTSTFGGSKS